MESVSEVEAAADQLATEAGLDEDQRFHIAMAVREAAINAVLHGNEYDPARQIDVSMENTGQDLVIVIADQGRDSIRKSARSAGAGEHSPRHRPRHLSHPVADG